jgi:WD40 repeat protein
LAGIHKRAQRVTLILIFFSLRGAILFRCSAVLLAIFLSTSVLTFAEGTRTWQQSSYDDFQKGTTHGVAISSDGVLQLAPAFKLIATTPSSAVWATAVGPKGEIYVATGAPARVYRITPGVQPVAIFQPQELQVQALAVAKSGVLYAATNPDGKIYKIEPRAPSNKKSSVEGRDARSSLSNHEAPSGEEGWGASVYFDPQTKYIWALALDDAGNLYVGTGDQGEIFRIAPNGEPSVFFKSDEPHIRVLAFDHAGNLIAGSDGSGLIYRITPKAEGFVLYSAPKREITSIAVDGEGNIFASATGERRAGGSSGPFSVIISGTGEKDSSGPANQSGPAPESVALSSGGAGVPGGSEIYKISPDGSPSRLWSSHDDLVYSLAFDGQGHLLAGSGNRGQIYQILAREDYTELLKAAANQVTAFTKAAQGGLYVSTSNLGKIFLLSDRPDSEGTYESDVFDAHIFSKWGRAEFRGKGNVELFARSGNVDNPDRNWSPWKKIDLESGAQIAAPPARFIQWKAVLHPGPVAPQVENVTLNYLSQNVAPEFDDVVVLPGTRYQSPPRPPNLEPGQRFDPQPNVIHDRQYIGVKWTVGDENDDQMVYSVYYRGDGQSRWLLLKDNLTDKFYSFDAALLPDGGYTIKVVASDAPSHSPGEALSSEKESDRFEVDSTPPEIDDLKAGLEGNTIHVNFRAVDSFSPIKRAEYSLDAGEWQFVEPVGQISDSKSENYDFTLPLPSGTIGQEHVVVVRAYDRYDNMVAAKTLIGAK